jgi:hypothetical protein
LLLRVGQLLREVAVGPTPERDTRHRRRVELCAHPGLAGRLSQGVLEEDAALQPKGSWIKHLNTQLSSVESTLDVIADFTDA